MRALLVLVLSFLCVGVALAEAFRCPTCEVHYGRSGYCAADGAQLETIPSDDAKAPTRVCRKCNTRYADGSSFCARDGKQLSPVEGATGGAARHEVKAGQEYVFESDMGQGPTAQLVYRVEKVEGRVVTYSMLTVVDMGGELKEFPAGGEQTWPLEVEPEGRGGAPQAQSKELPKETLRVGGVEFTCRVTETELPGGNGVTKVWVPLDAEGEPSFPPAIRSETTGGRMRIVMRLVEIRE